MHAHMRGAYLQQFMTWNAEYNTACLMRQPSISTIVLNVQLSKSQQPNGGLAFLFSLYTFHRRRFK